MTLREKQSALLSDLFYERAEAVEGKWLRRLEQKIMELQATMEDE